MKRILTSCLFLIFALSLYAQVSIDLDYFGHDDSPEYQNIEYVIEGSMTFHIRTDGTRYLSYDIIFGIYDPLAYNGLGIDVLGSIPVNGQNLNLIFDSFTNRGYFLNNEAGIYIYGETELPVGTTVGDLGVAVVNVDYVLKHFTLLLNH